MFFFLPDKHVCGKSRVACERNCLAANLIDRANEKGWRRELFDYLERKRLLQTPSEQSRLLQEVPKVIADELELEATPKVPLGDYYADPCGTDAAAQVILSESSVGKEGNGYVINGVTSIKEPEIRAAFEASRQNKKMDIVQQPKSPLTLVKIESIGGIWVVNSGEKNGSQRIAENQVFGSGVIELSDDDDDDDNKETGSPGCQNQVVDSCPESCIWYYTYPRGNIQGPFSLAALKRWSDADYFSPGFKIWKTGQNQNEAVLLIDVLRLMFRH